MTRKKTLVFIIAAALCGVPALRESLQKEDAAAADTRRTADMENGGGQRLPSEDGAGFRPQGGNAGLEVPLTPKGVPERILKRMCYTASFNRATNQPNWVAWRLTDVNLKDAVSRSKDFYADPDVPAPHRVTPEDYKGSGYDRGHMAPSADMKFSARAMKECFYMTNICPQDHALNAGGWEKLENACRRWAGRHKAVYIVCGPVFRGGKRRTIGEEHTVPVPDAFFKCVCTQGRRGPQAIAFLFRNGGGRQNMNDAAVSVDAVEEMTGIDFFHKLPDNIEDKVEKSFDIRLWQ